MYGETQRPVDQLGDTAVMEGVEHLGKYVYEMTNAKVEALKAGGGKLLDAGGDVRMEEDEDADRLENVIIPEEEVDDMGPEEPEEVRP